MSISTDLYERAAVIPGRSMTRSKAPGRMFAVGDGPMYAAAGSGAVIVDVEEHQYIDMLCGLGAISLGYRYGYADPGGTYSLPHKIEIQAAEAVLTSVAQWASTVRFVKSGSEATHAAYRIAKAATRRSIVFIGDWAYHGWHEWCSHPLTALVHDYPHGDGFDRWTGDDIAAVFIEPHRWEPVNVEWLKHVRAFCDRVGALMVFDEMIYGGRWALGGATEYFGVQPDMATFGKAFGNGQSVAFVVGNAALAEHGELVSGTYSGDYAGLSAVVETLRTYTRAPVIETLWARGTQLQRGLRSVIPATLGVCEGAPVHQRIRFHDPTHGKRFAASMAKRGVLYHPDVVNVCYSHTPEQIEKVIVAAEESAKCL